MDYIDDHIDDIDWIDEEDKFAGKDPKAGSLIKGRGFNAPRQKTKEEGRKKKKKKPKYKKRRRKKVGKGYVVYGNPK